MNGLLDIMAGQLDINGWTPRHHGWTTRHKWMDYWTSMDVLIDING